MLRIFILERPVQKRPFLVTQTFAQKRPLLTAVPARQIFSQGTAALKAAVLGDTDLRVEKASTEAVLGDADLCARKAVLKAAVPGDTDLRVETVVRMAVPSDIDLCRQERPL